MPRAASRESSPWYWHSNSNTLKTRALCVRMGSPCSLPTRWCPIERASTCNVQRPKRKSKKKKKKKDARCPMLGAGGWRPLEGCWAFVACCSLAPAPAAHCPAWRLVAVFRCPPTTKKTPYWALGAPRFASTRGSHRPPPLAPAGPLASRPSSGLACIVHIRQDKM
jgi:hypothetical protein